MTGRGFFSPGLCICMALAVAGCTSVSVGNVGYAADNVSVSISNTGSPLTAGVQATVYSLSEFGQNELNYTATTVYLTGPENTVAIPIHLGPGKYRIFLYVTENGERVAAVIRDITVQP